MPCQVDRGISIQLLFYRSAYFIFRYTHAEVHESFRLE